MNQIFIRVKREDGTYYDKDFNNCNEKEKDDFYDSCSKGQIVGLLKSIVLNMKGCK